MKKFLLLTLLLFMTACDFGTNTKNDVPKTDTVIVHDTIRPKDTTKVIAHRSVVISDTNISTTHTLNISGKISEKNSSGKDVGGFPTVVCLESLNKCTKTNSKGQYSFTSPRIKFAGRSLNTDTTLTPENILPDTTSDTTTQIDSVVIRDTITTSDSVIIIDTTNILHNVYVDNDTSHIDSVIVYSDSRILYEIPVTSWKSILPDKYVVQRDISGHILKNSYSNETKNAEAIYWSEDSIALRIPLELSNDKLAYSGFVYQPYDDSSFVTGNKNKNLFVRILDANDSVFGISNVVNFSERSGDLSVFLNQIIPGNIQRYPKPNMFRVIKDGDNVSQIITSEKIPVKMIVDLDSLFLRPMFTKAVSVELNTVTVNYKIDSTVIDLFDTTKIDSIGVSFYSNKIDTLNFYTSNDVIEDGVVKTSFILSVDSGYNIFRIKWSGQVKYRPIQVSKQIMVSLELPQENSMTDIRVKVWFKK